MKSRQVIYEGIYGAVEGHLWAREGIYGDAVAVKSKGSARCDEHLWSLGSPCPPYEGARTLIVRQAGSPSFRNLILLAAV